MSQVAPGEIMQRHVVAWTDIPARLDLHVLQGDSLRMLLDVVSHHGPPDLTWCREIVMTVVRRPGQSKPAVERKLEPSEKAPNQVLIELTPEETKRLLGTYYYDIVARWHSGQKTLLVGKLVVTDRGCAVDADADSAGEPQPAEPAPADAGVGRPTPREQRVQVARVLVAQASAWWKVLSTARDRLQETFRCARDRGFLAEEVCLRTCEALRDADEAAHSAVAVLLLQAMQQADGEAASGSESTGR